MSGVKVVAIGASLGGLTAVQTLLRGLPSALGASLVVVQHRRADPDSRLLHLLARVSPMPVQEPEDKTSLEPNNVYLAPSDYHLLVERGSLALSIDAPVRYARPSIDVLFESAADAYGAEVVGVMLTSSNEDGADGAKAIKRAGGRMLVQDPQTAESPIGPLAVMSNAKVDAVGTIEQLAVLLVDICNGH